MAGSSRRGARGARHDVSQRGREIGRRIAEARRESGLTQAEVAERLGVSERAFQTHEAGEVIPYRYLRDLEHVLDRPASWLLHGEKAASSEAGEILTELRALRTEVRDLGQAVRALTNQSAATP